MGGHKSPISLARPAGLEPATYGLEVLDRKCRANKINYLNRTPLQNKLPKARFFPYGGHKMATRIINQFPRTLDAHVTEEFCAESFLKFECKFQGPKTEPQRQCGLNISSAGAPYVWNGRKRRIHVRLKYPP